MKTFEEFVKELEPAFFEADDKGEEKGKKLPPWMKKDGDKGDAKADKGGEKKNPFMPKGKKKEEKKDC
jgi:hypothetical protein